MGYNDKYYKRHLEQYQEWENDIGKHIFNMFKPESILDLGCGVGSYLEGAVLSGCEDVLGVELNLKYARPYLVDVIISDIIRGDITRDLDIKRKFDCVVSFEVGEHIEPDGTIGFIDNLTRYSSNYIILTAAAPGQGGTGHINLREKKFWIDSIESKGFLYQEQLVDLCKIVWKQFDPGSYILKNLMIFAHGY